MKEALVIFQILNIVRSWFGPRAKDAGEPEPGPRGELIAICIGHSRAGDNGAVSVGGVDEWTYNKEIADLLRRKLMEMGHRVVIIDRYDGSTYPAAMRWLASELKRLGITFAIELHFNSYKDPDTEGFEYLYWHQSADGMAAAENLTRAQEEMFPESVKRGAKHRKNGQRGSLFLRLTHCPAVISEPFFGSNHLEWERYSSERGKRELAESIAEGIDRTLI